MCLHIVYLYVEGGGGGGNPRGGARPNSRDRTLQGRR